ncbi:MAG: HAMP domain-containing sensor histidine kinase [Treponemataceae bacterium]
MKRRFFIALLAIIALSAGASIVISEIAVGSIVKKLILERAGDRLSLITWSFGATAADVDIYSYVDFDREVLTVRKGKLLIFQYGTANLDFNAPTTKSLTRPAGSYEMTLYIDFAAAKAKYMELVRTPISIATLIFSLLFGIFGWLLLHSAVDPIVRLAASMAHITSRNLQTRVPVPKRKDEFGQLILTFNALLDEIQGTYERQSQFVDDMTHDIITPVQILEGYRQLIERHGRIDTLVDEYLDVSKDQLERLKSMAATLKSRLASAKRRNVERADASEVTERLVRYYTELFPAIRFEANIDPGVVLPVRKDDLERMENILLDNAVKYGTDGAGRGEVTVTLRAGKLSIRDRGRGIEASERESIFERRYRGRETDSRTDGAGLGLSILKKFAEEYGFRIVLESTVGQGAEFVLVFAGPNDGNTAN